jgi:hypothetical protein
MKLIDGDLIRESHADLPAHPIVEEKDAAGRLAHELDEDPQIDVLKIDGHPIRCGGSSLAE